MKIRCRKCKEVFPVVTEGATFETNLLESRGDASESNVYIVVECPHCGEENRTKMVPK